MTRLRTHLIDDVWCLTCEHIHIPTIPVVTFRCADCGFGVWDEGAAEWHATLYPDHIVYPEHHRTVEVRSTQLDWPRIMDVTKFTDQRGGYSEGSANADAWKERAQLPASALAWHRWRVESCVEFNGGHDLRLQKRIGDEPELACAHGCGVTMDDFTVEIEHVHYPATPDHSDEYDTFIGLEPRCES